MRGLVGWVVCGRVATAGAGRVRGRRRRVEQWGVFETQAKGPARGNPFVEVTFGARFTLGARTVEVPGFYDGNGVYRVRFSPDSVGNWGFVTTVVRGAGGHTGGLTCVAPQAGNRGPVGTAHELHFQYADGTPYFPFGTTCYSYWVHGGTV